MKKIDKNKIESAINKLIEWFPEEVEILKSNKSLITKNILNGTALPSTFIQIEHSIPKKEIKLTQSEVTPCEKAIGLVVFDTIMFAFGLVGLHVSNQERLEAALIKELSPTVLKGFASSIREFSDAEGSMAKAKALFSLLGGIWKAGGFKAAFKVIKKEMSWSEWIKTGIIAIAQITAWFATDGIAFIAEAALSIMNAEQLIEDSLKVTKIC